MLKRTKRVAPAPMPLDGVAHGLHELAAGCVAHVYLPEGGWSWVYVRKVGRKQISFVPLVWGAYTQKISVDEFDDRVRDVTVHPANDIELERFKRVTNAWREPVLDIIAQAAGDPRFATK